MILKNGFLALKDDLKYSKQHQKQIIKSKSDPNEALHMFLFSFIKEKKYLHKSDLETGLFTLKITFINKIITEMDFPVKITQRGIMLVPVFVEKSYFPDVFWL